MAALRGRLLAALAVASVFVVATETAGWVRPEASERVVFVPWKVLTTTPGDLRGDYVVYWIPLSAAELRHSPLLTSRVLVGYAQQCVAMEVVRPDDTPAIDRLLSSGREPSVILMGRDGAVLARVDGTGEALAAADVERVIHTALEERRSGLDHLLDEARAREQKSDRVSATELYRAVAAERCFAPRLARSAERALRKLEPR